MLNYVKVLSDYTFAGGYHRGSICWDSVRILWLWVILKAGIRLSLLPTSRDSLYSFITEVKWFVTELGLQLRTGQPVYRGFRFLAHETNTGLCLSISPTLRSPSL